MILVYTPGVWDMLHVGHLAFLERASILGDKLFVGVPSDEVVAEDKGHLPVVSLEQRMRMLAALKCVGAAVPYYALEFVTHLKMLRPEVLAVGEGWGTDRRHREAEAWAGANRCRVVHLPYTRNVSTSEIRHKCGRT